MSYTYKGMPCKVLNRYEGGLWLIDVSGARKTVNKTDVSEAKNKLIKANTPASRKDSELPTLELGVESKSDKVNVNNSDISQLSAITSIGIASARVIIQNKPKNGYESMEQLESLNHELNRVKWEVVAEEVSF